MWEKWPPTVRKFRVFVVAISNLMPLFGPGGPGFNAMCGYFQNVCLVWTRPVFEVMWEVSCENSTFSLRLFPYCMCVLRATVVWKFHVCIAVISGLCDRACFCLVFRLGFEQEFLLRCVSKLCTSMHVCACSLFIHVNAQSNFLLVCTLSINIWENSGMPYKVMAHYYKLHKLEWLWMRYWNGADLSTFRQISPEFQ